MVDKTKFQGSIQVNTRFDADTIEQEIRGLGMMQQVTQHIIKLQEKGVEEALISLGWTPPPNEVADPRDKLEQGIIRHTERVKGIAFSTGNIRVEDAAALSAMAKDYQEVWVAEREYGFFIKLFHGMDWRKLEKHLSDEFVAILQKCVNQSIYMVEIDADAEFIAGAPTFDW